MHAAVGLRLREMSVFSGLLGLEVAIGAAYLAAGLALLRFYERDARRRGSLELV